MISLTRAAKIAVLILVGIGIVCVVSVFASMTYAGIFLSHQSFAHSYPIPETDLRSEGILINISNSDFVQHPILRKLVQDPTGGRNIKFDRGEYRDQWKIDDFRNKYSSNRSVTRYVWWNHTYYQIIIGQE